MRAMCRGVRRSRASLIATEIGIGRERLSDKIAVNSGRDPARRANKSKAKVAEPEQEREWSGGQAGVNQWWAER